MHPARLRIHPARPGGASRGPGAGPSGRSAPCLPGGSGGDTGGRAPGLPRSFHFESTLVKFAKLVSRWLLRASREGAAHQPAVVAAPSSSRWLPRGLRRAAWEAGRAPRRAGAALPEPTGPHRAAQTPAPAAAWAVRSARAPLPALSPPPARPGPAPGPASYCPAPGGAGPEVRARRIAMETRESYRGGGGSGPLPGGRGPGSGAEKGGAAGPGQPPPVGVVAQPLGCRASPKTPSPNLAEISRGYRRPGGRTDWTRGGRRTGAEVPRRGLGRASPKEDRSGCWGPVTHLQQNSGG